MNFNQEQIQKALQCKSVDELIALAKAEGIELSEKEAESYFASLSAKDIKLDDLEKVNGGICECNVCGSNC